MTSNKRFFAVGELQDMDNFLQSLTVLMGQRKRSPHREMRFDGPIRLSPLALEWFLPKPRRAERVSDMEDNPDDAY